MMRFLCTITALAAVAAALPGPDLNVECAMRRVAYDAAQRTPMAAKHAAEIRTSLQLAACPKHDVVPKAWAEPAPCADGRHWSEGCGGDARAGSVTHLDCDKGSDANSGATAAAAVKTVQKAQALARGGTASRVLVSGACYVGKTLQLTKQDSNVAWSSTSGATLSGGAPLLTAGKPLAWSVHRGKIMVADLPASVDAAAVDGLFLVAAGGAGVSGSQRFVRARFPNGNSEVDRMPANYDKLGGGAGSEREWLRAGNVSHRFPSVRRNSSFYPAFGWSNDVRWVLDWHTENASSLFAPTNSDDAKGMSSSFWQSSVGRAARWNATTFSKKVSSWTEASDAVLHGTYRSPRLIPQVIPAVNSISNSDSLRLVGQLAVAAGGSGPPRSRVEDV